MDALSGGETTAVHVDENRRLLPVGVDWRRVVNVELVERSSDNQNTRENLLKHTDCLSVVPYWNVSRFTFSMISFLV